MSGRSCLAAPEIATCAAFFKEGRKEFASAKDFNRKSGGAQWRDLRFVHLKPSPTNSTISTPKPPPPHPYETA
jgi:hypothetical protein